MIEDKFPKKVAVTQVPIKGNCGETFKITWVAHWRAWCSYHLLFPGQTCERLEERGGFGENELDAFYPEWRNHIV